MPFLERITVYPIKSFDGMTVAGARVLSSGALEHDRRYALRDAAGNFITGKRQAKVHLLRAAFDAEAQSVLLKGPDLPSAYHLGKNRQALEACLSTFFAEPVTIVENEEGGFPDDLNAPGPTVVSTATLAEVASWFPGLSTDEVRRRFRANLEIGGVVPFWEDRLVAGPGQVVRFRIGEVWFEGVNPCQRCPVPTRDSHSGQADACFAREFALRRRTTLPSWAPVARFDHFYRLAVNTRLTAGHGGDMLRNGDEVCLGE